MQERIMMLEVREGLPRRSAISVETQMVKVGTKAL